MEETKKINNKFRYIPALSVGSLANAFKKNSRLADGTTPRYYSTEFYEDLQYPYFLITGGHFYKKMNVAEEWGLFEHPDMYLFGDSGGFQIATGAIKWTTQIRDQIFQWLQRNSNVAANIDIPPAIRVAFDFDHALQMSYDNFVYFADRQDGSTNFLNIMHGKTLPEMKRWYDKIKGFEFQGWGVGSGANSLMKIIGTVALLHEKKEFFNPANKYLHFLGTSKIESFILLTTLQNYYNAKQLDIQVTCDSSSPNCSRFGTYMVGSDYKKNSFVNVHYPMIRGVDPRNELFKGYHLEDYEKDLTKQALIKTNDFDKYIDDAYTLQDEVEYSPRYNHVLTLHNLYEIIKSVDTVDDIMDGPRYQQYQMFGANMYQLSRVMHDIMYAYDNDSTPLKEFKKYKHTIDKLNNASTTLKTIDHNFFSK